MHTAISLCKLHVFTSVIFAYLEPNKLEDQIDNKTVDDDQDENDEQMVASIFAPLVIR